MYCSRGKLPSYGRPPLIEMVCGVRFQPSKNFTLPYIGLLWSKFREEYPNVKHAAPLSSDRVGLLVDTVTGAPLPRVWFINKQGNQLVQFQPDRIYFNWRQHQDVYPRYENIIRNFEKVLDTLIAFFEESQLGDFNPVECELTYINHIEKKPEGETVGEMRRVFRDFLWNEAQRFFPNPIDISFNLKFALPDRKGQLITTVKQANSSEDNKPIIVLNLSAKGIGPSQDREGLREWFDMAHEWIVCGFADITTKSVQSEVWGREHG